MKGWSVPFAKYAAMINDNPLIPYRFDFALSGERCTCCKHWLKNVYNVFDLDDNTKAYGVIQTPDRILKEWSFTGCVNPKCTQGAVMSAIPFTDECKASLKRPRPTQKVVRKGTRQKAFRKERRQRGRRPRRR
uniref:Uncharacterized protein n=1 Tax=viral metagenome TaxID=1070528 RepID=A0A2V0R8Y3_9ZZZZ